MLNRLWHGLLDSGHKEHQAYCDLRRKSGPSSPDKGIGAAWQLADDFQNDTTFILNVATWLLTDKQTACLAPALLGWSNFIRPSEIQTMKSDIKQSILNLQQKILRAKLSCDKMSQVGVLLVGSAYLFSALFISGFSSDKNDIFLFKIGTACVLITGCLLFAVAYGLDRSWEQSYKHLNAFDVIDQAERCVKEALSHENKKPQVAPFINNPLPLNWFFSQTIIDAYAS